MFKKNIFVLFTLFLIAIIIIFYGVSGAIQAQTPPEYYFPLVRLELPTNTPTPTFTPTPTSTPTNTPLPPTPTNTPVPPTPTNTPTGPIPTPVFDPAKQLLVNGSFENGWTDLPPAPGNLINQQPNGWEIYFVPIGQPLFGSTDLAGGIPESIHKNKADLPPNEQPGGPNALVLDGDWVYKSFHFGAAFGTELKQTITGLTPGMSLHLVVPIQLHRHGDGDPYAAESGVWVTGTGLSLGQWVNGGIMGDRQWYDHVYDFNVPADGTVQVIIRVKSKWPSPKDFFFESIRLEQN